MLIEAIISHIFYSYSHVLDIRDVIDIPHQVNIKLNKINNGFCDDSLI